MVTIVTKVSAADAAGGDGQAEEAEKKYVKIPELLGVSRTRLCLVGAHN